MDNYNQLSHMGFMGHRRRISFALPQLKGNEYFQDIYLTDKDNIHVATIIDNQNVSYNIDYFLMELNGTLDNNNHNDHNNRNTDLQLIVDIKDKENGKENINIECHVLIGVSKWDMMRKKELYLQSNNEYVYFLYKSNRGNAEYKISPNVDLREELEYLLKDKLNDQYLWYVDMQVFTRNTHAKQHVEALFNASAFTSYICNIKYHERNEVWEHSVKYVL